MPVEKKSLSLTHAALVILASAFADSGPCANPAESAEAARMWGRIRRAFPRVVAGHDLDDQFARLPEEKDDAFARRVHEFNAAFKVWQDQVVELPLSNKQLEKCRATVKWLFDHKDKTQWRMPNNQHGLQLMVAIGLVDDEQDDA